MHLLSTRFFAPRRAAALVLLLASGLAQIHAQISQLGTASNYAALQVNALAALNIGGSSTVSGTVGSLTSGLLSVGAGSVVGTVANVLDTTQAALSAVAAAHYYGALTPNVTLSGLGATTITGTGGSDVYKINGNLTLNGQNLIIKGTSTDQFVINITGQVNLSNGANIILNGVSSSQVIFNLIGAGTKVTATGNSDLAGIFLAENGAISVTGGVHDAEFIAGSTLSLQGGSQTTPGCPPGGALAPVPEVSTIWMTAGSLVSLAGLVLISKRRSALRV